MLESEIALRKLETVIKPSEYNKAPGPKSYSKFLKC